MSLISFFKSKVFLKHLLLSLFATILIAFIILKLLNFYTNHGEFVQVPDINGKIAKNLLISNDYPDFEFIITDSVHITSKPKGSVISQHPTAGSKVKINRKIYLTVVAMLPEQVAMPELQDLSQRQAIAILETYELKVGAFEYEVSEYKNAVLDQKHKGRHIDPGTMLNKGSVITLVLGRKAGEVGENIDKNDDNN